VGKADLHMHSNYSDGYESVAQIIDYVERSTDLDVIAITDHDCIDGALEARDLVARGNCRLQIIVGAEISTRDGHLLALNIERLIPAGLSMVESIIAVHEQGGLAIVAHPLSRWCPSATLETLIDLELAKRLPDGLEVHNASFAGVASNSRSREINRVRFNWAETGGSDAHTVDAIGSSYTIFLGCSAAELLVAIRHRSTIAWGGYWSAVALLDYGYRKVREHVRLPNSALVDLAR
jgi:predicted metal-dependent phosphoesterase TrpH